MENPIMKFSWNSIRSAILISLGLTMVIMGVAWAIDPLPAAAAPLIAAPAIARVAPTGMGTTAIPISNEAPGVADADTEIIESEVTEEIPSPTQPGKKIKRKRKVRRRVKRRRKRAGKRAGKRTGMKFPHRIKSRSAAPIGMHASKMSPQQRKQWEVARRNYLVRAQRQRALMRIQRTPTSNLAKLRARQMKQLPPGAKKRGSRKTVGMIPSRGKGKGKRKGKSRKAGASKAQGSQTASIENPTDDTSQPTDGSADGAIEDTGQADGTTDAAPES